MWRRLHDRFARAVDRYHQVIEPVPAGELRDALEVCGARLAACLDVVRATCVQAQADVPSASLEVPGGAAAPLHARLSRSATLAAQAAEAATMARVRSTAVPGAAVPGAAVPGAAVARAGAGAAAVERAVAAVEALVSPGARG